MTVVYNHLKYIHQYTGIPVYIYLPHLEINIFVTTPMVI